MSGAWQWRRYLLSAMLGMAMSSVDAIAADIHITAEFTPDANDPNKRTFTNTTPWSGICTEPGHIENCKSRGIWGIDTTIRGTKSTSGTGERSYFYFGMPEPRRLTITDADGHQRQLTVRVVGMGYRFGYGESVDVGNGMSNCTVDLTNYGANTRSTMRLFRRHDQGQGRSACWSGRVQGTTGDREIQELDIVYELDAENPLEMPGGVYTGAIGYSIGGAGADIDLGDDVQLDADELTLNFTLTVTHYFGVRFPPGSARAILAPLGGWSQWTDHGRAPTALVKELPFQLSSSSLFGVTLRCQHAQADGRCAIHHQGNRAPDVPLDIRLTVPGVHDRTLGREVVEYPLTSTMNKPLLDPQGYVYERPSRLLFRVDGAPLTEMLTHPGSHYAGDVTVIFDADL